MSNSGSPQVRRPRRNPAIRHLPFAIVYWPLAIRAKATLASDTSHRIYRYSGVYVVYGWRTDGVRLVYGYCTDRVRILYGWCTDIVRMAYGWCTPSHTLV